jgi:hypothetical protein
MPQAYAVHHFFKKIDEAARERAILPRRFRSEQVAKDKISAKLPEEIKTISMF